MKGFDQSEIASQSETEVCLMANSKGFSQYTSLLLFRHLVRFGKVTFAGPKKAPENWGSRKEITEGEVTSAHAFSLSSSVPSILQLVLQTGI